MTEIIIITIGQKNTKQLIFRNIGLAHSLAVRIMRFSLAESSASSYCSPRPHSTHVAIASAPYGPRLCAHTHKVIQT